MGKVVGAMVLGVFVMVFLWTGFAQDGNQEPNNQRLEKIREELLKMRGENQNTFKALEDIKLLIEKAGRILQKIEQVQQKDKETEYTKKILKEIDEMRKTLEEQAKAKFVEETKKILKGVTTIFKNSLETMKSKNITDETRGVLDSIQGVLDDIDLELVLLGISQKTFEQGYLGIDAWIKKISETETRVIIDEVFDGSPADKAELKGGDIILKVNNTNIANLDDLAKALVGKEAGTEVEVTVLREDSQQTIKVMLGKLDTELLGLYLELRNGGIVINELLEDGLAHKVGLEIGDIILKVGNVEIDFIDGVNKVLAERRPGAELKFTVKRDSWRKIIKIYPGY